MNLWQDFLTNDQRIIHKWVHYFPVYERFFSSWRNKSLLFIEIGVSKGGSLQMWQRYFGPLAKIVGIDIDPQCKSYESPGIFVRIGDQSNHIFLAEIVDEFGVPDIVLDDGSHQMIDIASSFHFFYPLMNKNAIYMIEDLHTAYWDEYGGGINKSETFINFSKDCIDRLNAYHTRGQLEPDLITRETFGISFFDSIVCFEKGDVWWKTAPMTGRETRITSPTIPSESAMTSKNQELLQKQQRSATLHDTLQQRDLQLIVFPDWQQSEESLLQDLGRMMHTLVAHSEKSRMILLVDTSNTDAVAAKQALEGAARSVLSPEVLADPEGPVLFPLGQLDKTQWQALLPRLSARIVLERENKQALAAAQAEAIPSCQLDSLSSLTTWANEGIIVSMIDNTWSDDYGIGIQGWIFNTNYPLDQVEICVDGGSAQITAWHPRPDVAALYPQYQFTDNCGFRAYIPRLADHNVTFKAESEGRTWAQNLTFTAVKPQQPSYCLQNSSLGNFEEDRLFNDFRKLVNENQLRVLEIGSRIASPGSSSKRDLFSGASSYTGFDYHPDFNTDVVGDAHRLSQYFGTQRFDAIFSLAVFEHLAMPWVVAMEINKLLEIGGITYHWTTFAWPAHDRPWDYWRFSDDALKVLFSPALGFEIIEVGLYDPLRIHLDNIGPGFEDFPMHPGFGSVAILAKKVAPIDPEKFKWNVTIEEVLGAESHYPLP